MKKNLLLKGFLIVLLGIVFNSTSLLAQEIVFVYNAATVDAVSGDPADMPTMKLFEDAGYTVTPFSNLDITTFTNDELATLEGADLIYIGRTVTSGNFDPGKKELWNAIATPMMTGQMWALRSTKMNWFATADCANIDDPVDAIFTGDILEDDPVFEGLSGTLDWWTGPYSTINVTDAGNGLVLATKSTNSYVLFARFEADTEFYSGSVDMPAGPRTFFGSASDNMSVDGNKYFNYLGYSEDVMKVFMNEVANMMGLFEPEVPGVGVKNFDRKLKPSVYPVPAQDYVMVEMDNLKQIEMVDLNGKLIGKYVSEGNKLSMDVSNLNKGVYFLKISDNKGDTSIRKITKE